MSHNYRNLTQMVCWVFALGVSTVAQATVIADWRFEPGPDFLTDSSGNGHTLVSHGSVSSNASNPGSDPADTGSALFAGGWFDTTALNFGGARRVKISYSAFDTTTTTAILLETTTDYNFTDGAMVLVTHETGAGASTAAYRLSPGAGGASHGDGYTGTQSTWHQYVIDINLDAATAANIVQVIRDGTLLADATSYGHGLPTLTDTFANAVPYIGARSGGGFSFRGNMSYLTIETVTAIPEPSSLTLATLVGILLLPRAGRRLAASKS